MARQVLFSVADFTVRRAILLLLYTYKVQRSCENGKNQARNVQREEMKRWRNIKKKKKKTKNGL